MGSLGVVPRDLLGDDRAAGAVVSLVTGCDSVLRSFEIPSGGFLEQRMEKLREGVVISAQAVALTLIFGLVVIPHMIWHNLAR